MGGSPMAHSVIGAIIGTACGGSSYGSIATLAGCRKSNSKWSRWRSMGAASARHCQL